MIKTLIKFLIFPLLVLYGIKLVYDYLTKDKGDRSTNVNVSNAINSLDYAFRKIGTFDSDLLPLFDVLRNLTQSEIILLHKDFGYRYYNWIFKMFGITNIGSFGISEKTNLHGLYKNEFSSEQLLEVAKIYGSKGLSFPS